MINWRPENTYLAEYLLRLFPNCYWHMRKGCIPEYFPNVLNYKLRLTENIESMEPLMVFILLV